MIKEAIAQLVKREDLTSEVMEQVMEEIMTGEATDAQKASFLTALSMKGETIDEITSAAKVLRSHCERFLNDMDVLEIVGTGGDGSNTINISTLSSVVVSAAGIPVAKHGNRAASSKCGTADCLEALGVKIDCAPARSAQILKDINLCFLFAQKYHPAMRFVGAVRKEMGIRTLFNVLGPLANPAGATMQLFGVYSEELVEPLAHVLRNLGVKRAMVVYGRDSMDEISLSAETKVCEFKNDEFKSYVIKPEDLGLTRCNKEDLVGGTPQENAAIVNDILGGVLANDSTTVDGAYATDFTSASDVNAPDTITGNYASKHTATERTGSSYKEQDNSSLISYEEYLYVCETYKDILAKLFSAISADKGDNLAAELYNIVTGTSSERIGVTGTDIINNNSDEQQYIKTGKYYGQIEANAQFINRMPYDNVYKNDPQSVYQAQASMISPLVIKLLEQ